MLDIRREHPAATASVILRELVASGRITEGAVSETTVRRLLADHGLDRIPMRDGSGARTRLRWEAERPGALWHGDVCHGPTLTLGGDKVPVRAEVEVAHLDQVLEVARKCEVHEGEGDA